MASPSPAESDVPSTSGDAAAGERDAALSRLAGSLAPTTPPESSVDTSATTDRAVQSRGAVAAQTPAATAPKRRPQAAGTAARTSGSAPVRLANAPRSGLRMPDWLTTWQSAAVGSAVCFALFIMLTSIVASGFNTLLRVGSAAKAADAIQLGPSVAPSVTSTPSSSATGPTTRASPSPAPVTALTYSPLVPTRFSIVATHPHDVSAFTQGLAWVETSPTLTALQGSRDIMYESTGMNGESRLRYVKYSSNAPPSILKETSLPHRYFTEGIVLVNDSVLMLTWHDRVVRVYDGMTLELRAEVPQVTSSGEGWGITSDGSSLYVTDSSANLIVWDPVTLRETRRVTIHNGDGSSVTQVNEIEYIHGYIFGNIWTTDWIVVIDPADGLILSRFDCSALQPGNHRPLGADVLNGIAYRMSRVGEAPRLDAKPWDGYAWWTGKRYDTMWEMSLSGLQSAQELRQAGGFHPRRARAAAGAKDRKL